MMSDDNYDYYLEANNALKNDPTIKCIEVLTIIISVISMIFSSSVVFILLYKYERLVLGRSLIHILLMIAICDTIVSFSYAAGYPSGNMCKLQGFLAGTFEKGSWIFTDVLILNIYGILKWKVLLINVKTMHVVVWTTLILLAFLPYATGIDYGAQLQLLNITKCTFVNTKSSVGFPQVVAIWSAINESVLCCTILFISFITFLIYYEGTYRNENIVTNHDSRIESESWKTMILYPLSLLTCWVPSQCFILSLQFHQHRVPFSTAEKIADGLYMICPLHGLFLSIIFFTKTRQAKDEWIVIWKTLRNLKSNSNSFTSNSNKETNYELKDTSVNIIRIHE